MRCIQRLPAYCYTNPAWRRRIWRTARAKDAQFQGNAGIPATQASPHMRRGQPGLVLDALREASEAVQVLVTSHSPALLDTDEIDPGLIRAVVFEDGKTVIGPVDAASRTVLERHLYTAGELLRMNQLRP